MQFFRGLKYGLLLVAPFWVLLFFAYASWGATYYVDTNAAAGGDGTTSATTGEHCAWDTIADVNGASFSAGDSVLFNKGCTWREQLTVPSSGSDGSPITFGAYGTGDDPVISGAELITLGSAFTQQTGDLVAFDNFDDNDVSDWTLRDTGTGTVTAQNNRVEVNFGTSDQPCVLYKAFDAETEAWAYFKVYAATLSAANGTINSGGSGIFIADQLGAVVLGFTNDGGVWKWYTRYVTDAGDTRATATTLNMQQWYTVVMHWKAATAPGANNGIVSIWVDNELLLNVTDVDSDTKTAVGAGVGNRYTSAIADNSMIIYFDDFAAATDFYVPNLWSATLATQTYGPIRFDGEIHQSLALSKAQDYPYTTYPALLNATYDWWWYNSKLYIVSATDPDTAFTSIEVPQRTNGITCSQDYVTIDGLTVTGGQYLKDSGGGAIYIGAGADNVIITNSDLAYSGAGVMVGAYEVNPGHDIIIGPDNTIHHNVTGVKTYSHTGSGSGTESYVKGNDIYNNLRFGIGNWADYWIFEDNDIYDTGVALAGCTGIENQCIGLQLYALAEDGVGQHNISRRNKIHGTRGNSGDGGGLNFDVLADNNSSFYDVVYDNDSYGIGVNGPENITIYNATIYGNNQNTAGDLGATYLAEINIQGLASDRGDNLIIKNCAVYATESGAYAIKLDSYAYDWTGLTITNNDFYADGANFYYWNNSAGNILATWNALTGVGTDINTDPLFTNAAGDDFTLKPGSPCRHGAAYIPGYETKLRPGASWPDNVQTMQDILSIGAYGVYRGASGM